VFPSAGARHDCFGSICTCSQSILDNELLNPDAPQATPIKRATTSAFHPLQIQRQFAPSSRIGLRPSERLVQPAAQRAPAARCRNAYGGEVSWRPARNVLDKMPSPPFNGR